MPDDKKSASAPLSVRDITVLSMLLAFALVLSIAERYIPIDFTVPGVRLGLANVVILSSLYLFSFREAFILVILKCAASLFFTGSATAFIYGLSGSVLSLVFMALAIRVFGKRISPVGVSAIGAVFHNMGQLIAAAAVMRTVMVFAYLPMLMLAGVMTGIVVGILAKYVVSGIRGIVADGGKKGGYW